MRRLAALLLGMLGAGLVLAAPAAAHATVVGSSPADGSRLKSAPSSVTITFDESVGIGGIGYLHVTNGSGKRVDAGPAIHPGGVGSKVTDRLVSGLGNGTYTASFRVISADSHPVAGTIRFVVGHGALVRGNESTTATSNATGSLLDVARWITYAGFALLGGVWLLLTVWRAGRDDARARRLIWTGWCGVAAGALLEVLLQGPYTAGDAPSGLLRWSLLHSTLRTDYGQLHSVRLVLLGVLAILLARSLRTGAVPARWEALIGVLGVGVAYTISAGGHADTTNPNWLSIPVDMLHLLSMATWVGGLVLLVRIVVPRRDPTELRAVLPAYSTVAFISVVVLAASGTYAAWRGIGTVDAILTTTYGLLVLGKVALFVALLALGNLSRTMVRRRFTRPQLAYAMTDATLDQPPPAEQPPSGEPFAEADTGAAIDTERLRRSVYVETLVALLVLALTSVLVSEPRGKEALAVQYREPVTASTTLGGDRAVTVTADPGTHGTVQLTVTVSGADPTGVSASATQQAKEIGPIPVTLTKAAAGTYDGSAALPVAGRWEIDLVVTTSEFDATTTDVVLTLH